MFAIVEIGGVPEATTMSDNFLGTSAFFVGDRLRGARTSEVVSSAERESQQARAQQHKAGRCQREESIGNQIVIVHDKPAV